MAKNLASESIMAHVDQMTSTGGQDGALQQARNVDTLNGIQNVNDGSPIVSKQCTVNHKTWNQIKKNNKFLPPKTQILIRNISYHYRDEFPANVTKHFMTDSSRKVNIKNANNEERINDRTRSGDNFVIVVDSDGVVRYMVSFQIC